MEELINLLKTSGPKMVPFMNSVAIYFFVVTLDQKGDIWTTVLKCIPIICLIIFIFLCGFSLTEKHKYSQRIFCGLVFSCIGDALLNHSLFPHGMGAFALAQISYISAFGLRPLKLWYGIFLYLFGITFVSLIYNSLDDVLLIGLPIYAFLLTTMCWRSLARANHSPNFINILCGIGSILFVISDGCIAIDKFYTKFSNSSLYVMTTYYAAQFAITLSIVNEIKSEKTPIKKSKLNTIGNSSATTQNKKVK